MKTRIQVDGFDWDDGNRFKSEIKHGVTTFEIEWFFKQELWVLSDSQHSISEKRFLAIGESPQHQKPIMVIFTIREKGERKLIRPISARRMNEKEEKKFEEAFRKDQK